MILAYILGSIFSAYMILSQNSDPLSFFLVLISMIFGFKNLFKLRFKVSLSINLLYLALSCFYPSLLYGLPLVLSPSYLSLAIGAIIIYLKIPNPTVLYLFFSALMYMRILIKNKDEVKDQFESKGIELQLYRNEIEDHLYESELKYESKLDEVIVDERTRIARDIHDNVGYILSSALIQIGALKLTNKDPQLESLHETLNKGIDAMRLSVHKLYETNLSLDTEINTLIQESNFSPIYYTNTSKHISKEIIWLFVFVVKESINNTIKHSNATHIHIKVFEDDTSVVFLYTDNGTNNHDLIEGFGIQSIRSRIKSLHGLINISNTNGMRLYIRIPKKEQA